MASHGKKLVNIEPKLTELLFSIGAFQKKFVQSKLFLSLLLLIADNFLTFPILKGNFDPRFCWHQMQIKYFIDLNFIWAPGTKFGFADIVNCNFNKVDSVTHYKKQKTLLPHISFAVSSSNRKTRILFEEAWRISIIAKERFILNLSHT